MNKTFDKITLLNGSTEIDCVSYGTGGSSHCNGGVEDVLAPGAGETASRFPDGTGSWVIGISSKSGVTCESLGPTPSPSPTPEPTESPTDTPTSTPTPTKTSSLTPKPTVKSTKISKPRSVLGGDDESEEDSIDSMREELNGNGESEEESGDEEGEKKKNSVVAILIIICGVSLVGVAGYSFYVQRKKSVDTL